MGIRQAVNEHASLSAGVAVVVILAMLGIILWEAFSHPHPGPGAAAKAFYSDDDGQTWFVDTGSKLTPFTDANGRQAVYAFVFKCGDKPYVAYLLRATDEGRQAMERAGRSADEVPLNLMLSEAKKPGASTWVKFDPKNPKPFLAVTTPICRDGGKPTPVTPGR